MNPSRNPYPSDVSDDEWAFVAPYFTFLPEDAGQRTHSLREVAERLALDRPRRSAVAHDAQ